MKSLLSYIGKIGIPALLFAALGLSGCLRDNTDGVVPDNSGKTSGVVFNLSVPGMETVTRAGFSENEIRVLDILVFNNYDKLVEKASAEIMKTGLSGGAVTQAYASVKMEVGYTVVAVANLHDRIEMNAPLDVGKDAVMAFLVDQRNDANAFNVVWNQGRSQPQPLPMYGEVKLTAPISSTTEFLNIEMTRVHARIDFRMDDEDSCFTEIHFNQFSDAGVLTAEKAGNNILWGERKEFSYRPGSEFKETDGFYVFEASRVSDDFYANRAHIVVRAKYEGAFYYYRINFTSDGSLDGYAKGENIPVIRNYRYRVVVHEVLAPGYGSKAEAMAAAGEINNLNYKVLTYSESNHNKTHVVYDGNYYLGVDRTEFSVPKEGWDAASGSPLELWATTNYDTSYAGDGWKVSRADAGLIAVGVSNMTDFNSTVGNPIRFRVGPNPTDNDRELTFVVSAGKLSQTITVKQSGTSYPSSFTLSPAPGNALEFMRWGAKGEMLVTGPEKAQLFAKWNTRTGNVYVVAGQAAGVDYSNIGVSTFRFSSAAGMDDLNSAKTYSGGSHLFNFESIPLRYQMSDTYQISSIKFYADDQNGELLGEHVIRTNTRYCVPGIFDPVVLNEYNDLDFYTNTRRSIASVDYNKDAVSISYVNNVQKYPSDMDESVYADPFGYASPFSDKLTGELVLPRISRSQLGADAVVLTMKMESHPYLNGPLITENYEFTAYPVQPAANSYIVEPNTTFGAIPVTEILAAAGRDPITAAPTASVVWSDSPGVVTDVMLGGSKAHNNWTLVVKTGSVEGNAVVGITSAGHIRWSWHIWVTKDKATIEAGIGTNARWMDRNLGATANTTIGPSGYSNEQWEKARGLAYQWGRKDPFPVKRYYYKGGSVSTVFNDQNNESSTVTTIDAAIKNPVVFSNTGWTPPNGAATWTSSTKTVYDPCPPGWKVPDMAHMPAGGTFDADKDIRMINFGSHDIGSIPFAGYNYGTSFYFIISKYLYNDAYDTNNGTYTCLSVDSSYTAGDVTGNDTKDMGFIRCIRGPRYN